VQSGRPRIEEKRWRTEWELELVKLWEEEGLFRTDFEDGRPVLVIDTPPPYPSGRPHIGQTASYMHMDAIARFYRMRGYNVVFPFYLDRNGLPVEVAVERKLGVVAHEVPRGEFLSMCKRELDKLEEEFLAIFRRWGLSFDYWPRGTDSEEYRELTQRTFIELWKRGLVYEAERPTTWCPRCRTALAEAEIEYKEVEGLLHYIRFKLKDGGEIVIATTRPELLQAAVAVVYNPEDARYSHLKGRHALVPPDWHEVPILPHPSAKPEYGTGLVMVCTFGDVRDLAVVNELKLPLRVIVDEGGRIKEGKYAGMPVDEVRRRIVEDLEREGLLVRSERIVHTVPVCWRCKTPVEIIVTREFFVKQIEFKDKLIELANKMRFYPEEYRRTLIDWIKSLEFDWPISRRRYYATEIPIWYCRRGSSREPLVPKPGRYYRPWAEEPPEEIKEVCKDGVIEPETRVLDTWFDSSISWIYATGYTKVGPKLFEKAYPSRILRPQGYDIIRTWLYYSLLRAYLLYGDIPFAYVRINGMGLDERGEAMHKSKGNIVDPLDPVEEYGADAVRFWASAAGKLGSDYRYLPSLVKTGRDFVTKVWNIARFVSSFPEVDSGYKLRVLDRAVLARFYEVAQGVIKAYEEFDVYEPANRLLQFIWHEFADHYIEGVKSRAYNRGGRFSNEEQRGAWYTLYVVLRESLKLLHPIMPFVTDKIWRELYGRPIYRERIEDPPNEWRDPDLEELFRLFMEFNSSVWRYKNSRGISLAEPLDAVVHTVEKLEPLGDELKEMHKIRELKFGGSAEGRKIGIITVIE